MFLFISPSLKNQIEKQSLRLCFSIWLRYNRCNLPSSGG